MAAKKKNKPKHKQCIQCMVIRPVEFFPGGGCTCQYCKGKQTSSVNNSGSGQYQQSSGGTAVYAGLSTQ